mgnify:CR=1 FL=1
MILRDTIPETEEKELYWDDEERDPNEPNPDTMTDLELPKEFEFDPNV